MMLSETEKEARFNAVISALDGFPLDEAIGLAVYVAALGVHTVHNGAPLTPEDDILLLAQFHSAYQSHMEAAASAPHYVN